MLVGGGGIQHTHTWYTGLLSLRVLFAPDAVPKCWQGVCVWTSADLHQHDFQISVVAFARNKVIDLYTSRAMPLQSILAYITIVKLQKTSNTKRQVFTPVLAAASFWETSGPVFLFCKHQHMWALKTGPCQKVTLISLINVRLYYHDHCTLSHLYKGDLLRKEHHSKTALLCSPSQFGRCHRENSTAKKLVRWGSLLCGSQTGKNKRIPKFRAHITTLSS